MRVDSKLNDKQNFSFQILNFQFLCKIENETRKCVKETITQPTKEQINSQRPPMGLHCGVPNVDIETISLNRRHHVDEGQ